MNLPWTQRKPPYSLAELDGQVGNIAHLSKLRDAAFQKALLYGSEGGSDVKQQRYLEQADSFDEAIAIATEVLKFMSSEVVAYNKARQPKGK